MKQLQSFTVYYVHIKACPYLGLSQVLEPASNVDAQDKSENMGADKGWITCGGCVTVIPKIFPSLSL